MNNRKEWKMDFEVCYVFSQNCYERFLKNSNSKKVQMSRKRSKSFLNYFRLEIRRAIHLT